MIEIKIPKEVNTYEAKFIGPFTLRQSICLLIAMPACILLYNLLGSIVPRDLLFLFMIIPAGIAYLFGWFKPYGLKFEKFLQNVFITAFVAPSKRKYSTENYFAYLNEQIRKEEQESASDNEKKGKNVKKKYRISKDAIK